MSQPQDPSRTSFLDLSAEIRNKIYGMTLVSDKPLLVTKQKRAELTPNILATCATIKAEATAILYGANIIETCIYTLNTWLRQHQAPSRYIRHIRVGPPVDFVPVTWLCARLKKAVMLQSLELCARFEPDHIEWPDVEQKLEDKSARQIANAFRPLAKALKKNGKKANGKTKLLYNVVTFYAETCEWEPESLRSHVMAEMAKLTADVRTELKAFMEEKGLSVVTAWIGEPLRLFKD